MLRLQAAQLPATVLAYKLRLRVNFALSAEVLNPTQQQNCFAGMK